MMSLISPRHGVHHEAQKFRNTGWPLKAHRLRVSPASVLRVKSGALEPGAWDESTAAAVVSAAHAIDVGRERSEEHTSELQSLAYLVCRLLLEKTNGVPVTVALAVLDH